MINGKRRLLALLAGAVAAACSLWIVGLIFEQVPAIRTNKFWLWVRIIGMFLGFLPGVALYLVLNWCLPQPIGDSGETPAGE
jgi:hypothetical protein